MRSLRIETDESLKDVVTQGLLGTKILQGEAQKKYLYDIKAFDSDLEKEIIHSEIEEVRFLCLI